MGNSILISHVNESVHNNSGLSWKRIDRMNSCWYNEGYDVKWIDDCVVNDLVADTQCS